MSGPPERGPLEVRLEGMTVTVPNAVRFGDWVAIPNILQRDWTFPDAAWTVYGHTAKVMLTWATTQAVAERAAELLDAELGVPDQEPMKDWVARFRAAWPRIRDSALSCRPPAAARPFTVRITVEASIVVLAESQDDALTAVERFSDDRLQGFLRGTPPSLSACDNGANEACEDAFVSFAGDHNDHDAYLWAVEGRAYRPSQCPVALYLDEHPSDHWARCERREGSGACTCDARVFPAKPPGANE